MKPEGILELVGNCQDPLLPKICLTITVFQDQVCLHMPQGTTSRSMQELLKLKARLYSY